MNTSSMPEEVGRIASWLGDKEKLKIWARKNADAIKAWGALALGCLVMYHLFSDGDFSVLLTLSSLISAFGFLMVIYNIEVTRSCSGVSVKMMECYVLILFLRLCAIIPFEGYLPYDRSGDWLYQTLEAFSFCFAGTILYMCRARYCETVRGEADAFKHYFLIGGATLLAIGFHPSLNAFMPTDIAWTLALYLEAVCVLPQLFMFQKQGTVEPFTTHFLISQALSKVLSFLFWISSYSELNSAQGLKSYVGVWVMAAQVLQLAIMADFVYHYCRCLSRGVPVQFLLSEHV